MLRRPLRNLQGDPQGERLPLSKPSAYFQVFTVVDVQSMKYIIYVCSCKMFYKY